LIISALSTKQGLTLYAVPPARAHEPPHHLKAPFLAIFLNTGVLLMIGLN